MILIYTEKLDTCYKKLKKKNLFCYPTWDLNRSFTFNMPTHYPLDYNQLNAVSLLSLKCVL